ncbi:MAG: eukaryotic-like serine/threonine-protein kinase [Blastocatellia bacterium]|jgi:serine/threonine protein kinase/Tol biopolymer transport system component|nr:eukaryotic-like serine/threonine-protein kinase [Blastocatellia bacterium]
MIQNRWQTIKELFNAALQRAPEERAGFLDEACGDDEVVRNEVASLLAAHISDESFLAVPAFQMGAELLLDSNAGPAAGDQIGPYKILSELGSGGMGDVFLAQDTRLGRNIALKLLPVDVARDLQRVRRFEQEARTASALNHPNVCVIHEIGKTSDGRQFIAMEYIDGVTLRTRLAQQRMTLTETLDVGAQVAWALEAAHAAGVVHRDIKPENIMLRRDGYVKVVDFGIAKLNENLSPPTAFDEASTLGKVNTDPGTRLGTVKYMSPEQLRERPVDERTDIWSLGVVLHEMATGETPFAARTTNETIAAILERQPLNFEGYAQDIPLGLRRIIKKALSKNRRERYQKVTSLAADLRQVRRQIDAERHGESSGSDSDGTEKLIGIVRQPVVDFAAPAPLQKKTFLSSTAESILTEIKQHRKATIFAGVGAVLALLVVGYVSGVFRPSQEPPPHKLEFTSLTNTGTSVCAAISPDGKWVAHAESKNGMQELVVTSVGTPGNSVVVPLAPPQYRGVTFSRDGFYLYYTISEKGGSGTLYQVALPKSTPRKIKEGVDSPITFSPTGDRFGFVRFDRAANEYSLMIAGSDGTNERTIATRRGGNTLSLGGPAWSPDEEVIICSAGKWENGYHETLIEFGLENGQERPFIDQQWYAVLQVAWLENKSGLIISANERPLSPFQLWQVSYPDRRVVRITNNPERYEGVSISREGGEIVSLRSYQDAQIFVLPLGDSERAHSLMRNVGRVYGVDWTNNGRIVYSWTTRNNLNLSAIDRDGANQVQLTGDAGDDIFPAASPDGRFIVFVSNRTGSLNLWRINADDGGDLKQLTFGDGNSSPSVSPDGQWVLYDNQSNGKFTIWKVPVDGGEPVQIGESARSPVLSPDGQFIACRYYVEGAESPSIAILPFQGKSPPKVLPIPVMDWQRIQWTPDGRALTYVKAVDGRSNIWRYELADGSATQLTNFKTDDQIFAYAWSPDYKELACERGLKVSDVMIIYNRK